MRHQHLAVRGLSLHAVTDGPEDGPLVVLLHGFPELWFGWRRQLPFLAARGFRVVALDQRGYGESDKPQGLAAYELDELARDVVAVIDACGREQAIVVGHDWGAAVAWWVAMYHPERVARMVAMNVPHPHVMRAHLLGSPRQLAKSSYMLFFQLPALPERALLAGGGRRLRELLLRWGRPGTFTEADLEVYREAWLRPGAATGMLSWYRAIPRTIGRPIDPATLRVRVPAMLIWGREDPILGEEMAAPSVALCERGRLELIERAGHFVQHDAAERVNALLADFLGDPGAPVSRGDAG